MSEVWSGVVGVRKSEAAVYRDIVLKWRGCALERRCLCLHMHGCVFAFACMCYVGMYVGMCMGMVCVCVWCVCPRVRACVVRVPSSIVLFVRVTCVWCLC